jgi:hypothetical protein
MRRLQRFTFPKIGDLHAKNADLNFIGAVTREISGAELSLCGD